MDNDWNNNNEIDNSQTPDSSNLEDKIDSFNDVTEDINVDEIYDNDDISFVDEDMPSFGDDKPTQEIPNHNRESQFDNERPYDFSKSRSSFNRSDNYNITPEFDEKKNSKGKKAIIAIIIIALVFATGSAFLSRLGKNETVTTTNESSTLFSIDSTSTTESTTVSNSQPTEHATQNILIPTVPIQTTAPVASELSAVQIAEKCRPISVGVLVYKDGRLNGEGSGVVMGFDANKSHTYIMTCAHVISDQDVTFSILKLDGTSKTAQLVGYDTKTDIGVLKVEGTDYTVAEFGDSSNLKIGENVYAIGNPGGSDYFGSMTRGIISAIDRAVSGTRNLTCIQHDAAINPGNSGGALLNSKGQVIGINSSKISDTDYEGMGFAVPINLAKSISESLINYGYVPNRPKLGITYADVNDYQIYSMVVAIKGLPTGSLIITSITDDSAFVDTKAEVGDMIIAVNGNKMNSPNVLLDMIDKGAVGESIQLTLCRVNSRTYQTSTFNVTVKLVEDRGAKTTTTTTEAATNIYDSNYGSGSSPYGDFGDFFRDYFGF